MADDGGVWVKAQQGVSTTGGGIYTKVADDGGKWVEIGADHPTRNDLIAQIAELKAQIKDLQKDK